LSVGSRLEFRHFQGTQGGGDPGNYTNFKEVDANRMGEERIQILAPTGESNGQRVHFMFAYKDTPNDIITQANSKVNLRSHIHNLREAGYEVQLTTNTTEATVKAAISSDNTAGIYLQSHADTAGGIILSGSDLFPGEISDLKVGRNMKFFIAAGCGTANPRGNTTYAEQFGKYGVKFHGWNNEVPNRDIWDFQTTVPFDSFSGHGGTTSWELRDYVNYIMK
jgi:hypothetical protein